MKEFVKMVVAFFAVFGEMGKQMYLSTVTPSEEWEKMQDEKLSAERKAGLEAEKEAEK